MTQINVLYPIVSGLEDSHKQFLAQLAGPRRTEYGLRCERLGITWERGFYQQTPHGMLYLQVTETSSPTGFLAQVAEPTLPVEHWYLEQLQRHHGVSPGRMKSQPLQQVMQWVAPGQRLGRPTAALALPIMPGLTEEWRRFTHRCESAPDFVLECARLGINRQTCYLQSTPQGDYGVMAFEGEQLELLGKRLAAPAGAFGTWGLAHLSRLNGCSPETATRLVVPSLAFEFEAAELMSGASR